MKKYLEVYIKVSGYKRLLIETDQEIDEITEAYINNNPEIILTEVSECDEIIDDIYELKIGQ